MLTSPCLALSLYYCIYLADKLWNLADKVLVRSNQDHISYGYCTYQNFHAENCSCLEKFCKKSRHCCGQALKLRLSWLRFVWLQCTFLRHLASLISPHFHSLISREPED